jgi:hypothetical protein
VTFDSPSKGLTTNGGADSHTWTGLANDAYSYSIGVASGGHQSTLSSNGAVIVNGASVNEPTLRATHGGTARPGPR